MTAVAPETPNRPNYIDWLSIYEGVDSRTVVKIDRCDENWLDAETTQYKFDDEDPLKQHVTTVKKAGWHVLGKGGEDVDEDDLKTAFDEIKDLSELSAVNNINLCRMGGMAAVMSLIVKHSSDEIRTLAARLFASMTSNEKKIQAYANRSGALNFILQFNKENTPKMKEVILGALLAFIKAENFQAKREFLFFYDGIQTLSTWIAEDAKQPSPINP